MRQEHSLRVFENRVLRKTLQCKYNEVKGDWRKLHNQVLHDLYYYPNIILVVRSVIMRWMWHVERMGERRGSYSVSVEKPKDCKLFETLA